MAKKKPKLPQNVQLLQRRYEAAQMEFNREFQARLGEYTNEVIPEFEQEIRGYEDRALAFVDRTNQYSDYVGSFFIKPGTNDVEQFVRYGNNYYWKEDIGGGFNLQGISSMPSLSGTDYQFVKTGTEKHIYSYQSYEYVPSGRWEMQAYTQYEMQLKPVTKMVYVPGSGTGLGIGNPAFSSPIGTPISSGISTIQPINLNPGVSSISSGGVGGRYEMQTVNEFVSVPVTKYRNTYVDTSSYKFVPKAAVEDIEVGYLKTALPDGGFTPLTPEQFSVRSSPGEFKEAVPEAPPGLDLSDIQSLLEEEAAYVRRETGEIAASAKQARMRKRVRPLLADTGEV